MTKYVNVLQRNILSIWCLANIMMNSTSDKIPGKNLQMFNKKSTMYKVAIVNTLEIPRELMSCSS